MHLASPRRLPPIAFALTWAAIITAVLTSPLTRLAGAAPIEPNSVAAPCLLGETRPDNQSVGYSGTALAAIFVLVNPADCAGCSGTVEVQNAVATIAPQGTACNVTLRATMIGAGGTPDCPTPDTTVVLCPSSTATFPVPALAPFDASIPMSQCCINKVAFLRIEILSSDCPNGRGFRAVTNPCVPCRTYSLLDFGGGAKFLVDTCPGNANNWHMYAQVDCCDATPSRHGSWGSIKTLYR